MQQRYDAVLGVIRDGLTVTEVAEAYGVSRQTMYLWLKRYEGGGLEALAEQSHRPRSCPHQIAPAIEARILELRRQHPRWGPIHLGHQLDREKVENVPSHMAIYRALVRHGLIEPKSKRKTTPDLQTLGTGSPDGALADGHRGRGPLRRRHRVQGADRGRRPLPVLRLRRDHDAGHGSAGLRVLRRGPGGPRGARGDLD